MIMKFGPPSFIDKGDQCEVLYCTNLGFIHTFLVSRHTVIQMVFKFYYTVLYTVSDI